MFDDKTIYRNYPLPHSRNKLKEDALRIKDSFEKADIDINDLYEISTGLSTQVDNLTSGSVWQSVSTGTGINYDVDLNPPATSLILGLFIHMKAHVQNTGPATLNVNSLGAQSIKKIDGSDLKAGDIPENAVVTLIYDGTNFQLANSALDSEQTELNASNIFRAFEEIQENHGGALFMEAGWSDSFSNANEQGADETNSTSFQHDSTNKLYKGTDPGTGLNVDQDFTVEGDYEFHKESLSDITVSGDVVTLNSGTLGTNISHGRAIIGANEAVIISRDSDTQFTVESSHSLTGTNVACEIRFHKFDTGIIKLNGQEIKSIDVSITTSGAHAQDIGNSLSGNEKVGQSVTTLNMGILHSVEFKLKKIGSPLDNYFCQVYAFSGGSLIEPAIATSDNVNVSEIGTSFETVNFIFSETQKITLSSSTEYGFVLARDGNVDASNYLKVRAQNANVYSGGLQIRRNNSAWEHNSGSDVDFVLNYGTVENVTNEYIPLFPKYAKLADPTEWSDENSLAQTETLNSANIWYFEIFATVNYGANTVLKITDGASGNVRSIVQNNAGVWEYNSNATFGSTTWTNATVNSMTQAIIEAIEISVNRMTGTIRSATPDTATLLDTTKKRGTGIILYSTVSTNNPEVDQTRINYDAPRGAMELKSKTYNPGFVPNEAYVWSRAEHSDVDGPGAFSISRNGGAEWETVSMVQQGLPLSGDVRILRGTVDISGQTSGQDLRCRYQTTQGKDQFLHSWGLQVKS